MLQAIEKLHRLKNNAVCIILQKRALGDDYPFEQLKPHFPNCNILGLQSHNDVKSITIKSRVLSEKLLS